MIKENQKNRQSSHDGPPNIERAFRFWLFSKAAPYLGVGVFEARLREVYDGRTALSPNQIMILVKSNNYSKQQLK